MGTVPALVEQHSEPIDVDFDAAYRIGAPWDIGRPQPAVLRLIEASPPAGPVLDAGCGTGDNGLAIAELGIEVVGVDTSSLAVERANVKASQRGLNAHFVTLDVYELSRLGRRFRTALDCALLHVIGDRERYVSQLATVLEDGGRVVLHEISDRADIPYPKISEEQIRAAFPEPTWEIESLSETTLETHLGVFPAWLGVVVKIRGDGRSDRSPPVREAPSVPPRPSASSLHQSPNVSRRNSRTSALTASRASSS